MTVFQPDIPPDVAEVVRHLPPDVKRSVKHAIRALSLNPDAGEPLRRAREGLWKYWVRRFRIVYTMIARTGSSALSRLATGAASTKR